MLVYKQNTSDSRDSKAKLAREKNFNICALYRGFFLKVYWSVVSEILDITETFPRRSLGE